ncbi:RecB family exonuclease [Chromobacterium violaceum]|uniref:PD-(D/E)XK endonuclease-like domain-containing protein n=1 Tax=Chromobacterium violaceum TaxID=536 RepID=A0A202B5L7_CHRVL|nr:PD-(D/E)XK nuclease family protein [Chromobacterium violaceum]OVE46715.1 hypothetical protein CBW21_17625 [Chromobacterium violaceum]
MSDAFRVRASSWGSLFDCAHRWEATHILGMNMPSSPRAQLGTAIHAATAAYDQAVLDGAPIRIDAAAGVLVDEINNPGREVDWSADELTPRQAAQTGIQLLTRYCQEIAPRYQYVAIELPVTPWRIDCGGGIAIEITGTLDRSRARIGSAGVGLCDLKSGSAAVVNGRAKTKGHAPQIGTYELLYERTTSTPVTEPADIIGLKTRGAPEVATGQIIGAREQLIGTAEQPGLMDYAAEMFKSGLFPPNPVSHMCSQKYCARWRTCKFKDQ